MFQSLAQQTPDHHWIAQLIASAGLVGVALLLRWALRRGIQVHDKASQELRRRWLLQVRNLTLALVALGLALIWATELKTAALSIVAFVVALVLATKELILCVSGSFLKISSKAFVLGDHIEVGGVRGEVIDQTLLTTKLMETSAAANGQQFTGRIVTLPNALLLSQAVTNESLTKSFGLHVFTVPVQADANWAKHEAALSEAVSSACEPYLDRARQALAALSRQEGLDAPNVEPRVHVSIVEPGRVDLIVRLPYPVESKARVIQQVLRGYLERAAAFEDAGSNKTPPTADEADARPED